MASDIKQGSWIEESLVELPKAPPLETLPLATRKAPEREPLEGYTFEGYRNKDGSVGTKNMLGITTSVHCVAGVVDYVRVTDHRIGLTLQKLDIILSGKLDEVVDALVLYDQTQKLEELNK